MQFPRTQSAWACIAASLLLAACHSVPELPASPPATSLVTLDSLAIPVSAEENRAVSFTNKRSAFYAAAGDALIVEQTADSLIVHHVGIGGSERECVTLAPSPVRREQQARVDAILAGTEFAKPGVAAAHPAMRQTRTP